MKISKVSAGVVSLALLSGAGVWAYAQQGQPAGQVQGKADEDGEENDDEVVIKLSDAPAGVRAAAAKLTAAANIKKVIKESDEGITTYEIEYTDVGVACSAILSTDGELMEIEKGTTEAKLPAAVMAALKKDYPQGVFSDPLTVTKYGYEIVVTVNGKKHGVEINAAGSIEDKAKGGENDEEHEKAEGGKEGKGKKEKKGEKDDDDDDID